GQINSLKADLNFVPDFSLETTEQDKFFSPLVKSIAKQEGISLVELEKINGSGKDGRINKDDILL
ncbi:MAG TPA: 2-oxoglutarate dehydrogenase, partial [Flavobacterium sp.]|nr:2-oxoglutarate dehydrogenase [Flavobacterium sp.]